MSSDETTKSTWRGFMPRGRSALIGVLLVAVVAFFLGGLFLGEGAPEATSSDAEHQHEAAGIEEPSLWTCSMHPQIQLPKEGKCPICFMDLIPVETGGDELDPNQIRMSETARKLARIETTPVVRAFAEREIRMPGKLDYDESRLAYLTAWVPGRLERLYVDFTGARVRKGERLVQLYSPELIAAQEELLQAKLTVESLNQTGSSVLRRTATETVRSAREKLRLLGLTEQQIAELEASGERSEYLNITAPAGGVVIHKNATEGMYVTTGTRIYTIADLSQLWVLLEAYESDLPWLSEGQELTFTSTACPGEQFQAVINFIDPVLDPTSRTVRVRAVVENRDGRLKPDMFVSGVVAARLAAANAIPGGEDESPLLIPVTAPLLTGKRAVVYIEIPSDGGPLFEGREVELGPRAGDFYVVKTGVEEGESVVVNGAFKIDSELQIRARPSMMSPKGGAIMTGHQHGQPTTGGENQVSIEVYKAGTVSRTDAPANALAVLNPVYDAYFGVQMALADDDPERATEEYERLDAALHAVDMSLFVGELHERWMKLEAALSAATADGQQAKTIEAARDAFFYLSQAAIELHDTFGHEDAENYYLTFCPMARDNKGAFWLQTVDTVYNSFYGDLMLRCGSIEKSLPGSDQAGDR
jgi:Cu(I)/Ag(I) efflux system membrane fusion protein